MPRTEDPKIHCEHPKDWRATACGTRSFYYNLPLHLFKATLRDGLVDEETVCLNCLKERLLGWFVDREITIKD